MHTNNQISQKSKQVQSIPSLGVNHTTASPLTATASPVTAATNTNVATPNANKVQVQPNNLQMTQNQCTISIQNGIAALIDALKPFQGIQVGFKTQVSRDVFNLVTRKAHEFIKYGSNIYKKNIKTQLSFLADICKETPYLLSQLRFLHSYLRSVSATQTLSNVNVSNVSNNTSNVANNTSNVSNNTNLQTNHVTPKLNITDVTKDHHIPIPVEAHQPSAQMRNNDSFTQSSQADDTHNDTNQIRSNNQSHQNPQSTQNQNTQSTQLQYANNENYTNQDSNQDDQYTYENRYDI